MTTNDSGCGDIGQKSCWAGRFLPLTGCGIALVVLLAATAAGLGSRIGLWNFRTGFAILKWAAYGGFLAAGLSLVGLLFAARQRRVKRFLVALLGLAVGGVVFYLPLSFKFAAQRVPPIHDITTDIDRPPLFVDILPLRKDAPNPAEYGGAEIAVKQRAAYPDIQTVILNLPQNEAFPRAVDAARAMGWKIISTVPAEGRIEATDTTFWFGFKDDIVVRITPADHRSLLDVRSVSRVGRSDVGTNAARIRAYIRRLTAAG